MNSEQAAAPSAADSPTLEQRAASIFGDAPKPQPKPQPQQVRQAVQPDEQTDQAPTPEDATNESPQGEDSTAPSFEEVEYEGELYQVPPKLKEAIIRQSDYTKKTQEVAETRKLIEHQQSQLRVAQQQAAFEKEVSPQLNEISRIDAQLAQYDQLNWRELDAENRTLHMLEMQRLEKLKAAKENEINGKRQEHSQKLNEQLRKLQAEANDVLKARIPGWSDTVAKEVGKWAVDNGFTQDEVSSIYDPRHAEVLWKAAQYDKARKGAQPAVAAARAAKPTSSNPMPQHVKQKLAFRKELSKTQQGSPERRKLIESRAADIFK
jgi:hypothetical protein